MTRLQAILALTTVMALGSINFDAAAAEQASIIAKADDGSVLKLDNGFTYLVSSIDRIDSQLWMVGDEVVVLDDDSIVNTDENGEKVEAQIIN